MQLSQRVKVYGLCEQYFPHCPKARALYSCRSKYFLFLFCLFLILWLIKQLLEVLIFYKIATNYYNYIYLVVQCILFTSWVVENHYIMVAVFYKKSNIIYKYYSKIKLIYLVLKILATKPFCWMVSYMVYSKIVKKGLGNQKKLEYQPTCKSVLKNTISWWNFWNYII